jgi:phage terminase large subunit
MKTKNRHELSAKQKEFVRNVVSDPVLFATHILGVSLWDREAEVLHSIRTSRRTAVKACHGVGKTFTLAVAALWWLARYPEGIVLTTSPTQRQVRTQLWSEIHRAVERARVPYPSLKTTELKFRDNNNFAIGFSTNQTENFQGYHGKYVLIIADEAPGSTSGIWDAVAGTMAGGTVHIVMAGNPTVPSDAFFDAFSKERGLWSCFTSDPFDSPNLKGLGLEQLLRLDPSEGGPLDRNPIPYLVTKRWVYARHDRVNGSADQKSLDALSTSPQAGFLNRSQSLWTLWATPSFMSGGKWEYELRPPCWECQVFACASSA